MDKHTLKPGDRLEKNGIGMHVKSVYPDGVLTTRGFRFYTELQGWERKKLPSYKTWSIRLSLADYEACIKHFGNPSAAVRWAIAKQEGKI